MDTLGTVVSALIKAVAGIVIVVLAVITGKPVTQPLPLQVATAPTPTTNSSADFPTASTTHKTTAVTPTPKTSTKPAATAVVATSPQTTTISTKPVAQALSDEALNTIARASIVNILCTTQTGGTFKPISGSGVMVDGRGVVLTNAHVAQFFLLRDYPRPGNIDCTIRTGSPAVNTYHAELLYLPPQWIDDNAKEITSSQASGTGENDFAFVRITGPYNPTATVSSSIPHLTMSNAALDIGDRMLLAAYPAGFLSGELIATQLYASSAFAYVTQLFTFDQSINTIDLFSVGGSVESQAGSSGGAVVRQDGSLAGIISTAILSGSTGQRDLRAVSVGFINRALGKFGKGGITELLTGDLAAKAADFNANVAPGETAKLKAALGTN